MSQKPISSNSIQLKNQINSLSEARISIQKGNDVSGSMVKLSKTLNNIQPLLKKQQSFIKNFFTTQQSTTAENKQSQQRRTLNRICQIAMNDINDLLNISEQYFSIDFKNSWNKIKNNFQKDFNAAKQQVQQKGIVDFLFRVINLKDYFIFNFLKSFMYKKLLLWKDLSMNETGYVHSEKKSLSKLIEEQMYQKGYVPTKLAFDWPGFNIKGRWNMNKLDTQQYDLKTMLKIINQSMQVVFQVLRNYASLNSDQRKSDDIDRNKQRVKSLREQIQQSKLNYLALQKKYRQAVLKQDKSDLLQLREKVNNLQDQLQNRQGELKKIKFQFRDSSNQINSLKQKIKQLQSDLNRISNQQMKKLKQIQVSQSSLNDEFVKIFKNVNNFGSMFEFQSDGKKSLVKQIQSHQKTIEKLVDILGRQKKKSRQQKEEIARLNHIIFELAQKLKLKES